MVELKPFEISAMSKWPGCLRALADYHDYQETCAGAMDFEERAAEA